MKNPPPNSLPTLDAAKRELLKREARAFAWMLLRLVSVALLITLLLRAAPALASFRVVLDAIGGVLILAPLFTALGQTFAWRIQIGKAFADAKRFADADALLLPLSGLRATLFDARGEGRFYRAIALHGLHRDADAETLFRDVAATGRDPWHEKAQAELSAPQAVSSTRKAKA
ncbi:MAG: hypothetical protein H7Y38_14350 [Armatimonadetes bacterium]|nr:hypothetical protein [Armatimonadota bacterium]